MNMIESNVILITGASQGIGKATALAFAKEHVRLILTYNEHQEDADAIAKEAISLGAEDVLLVKLDLLVPQSIQDCFVTVQEKFGTIDTLINNAGMGMWKNLSDQSDVEIETQIGINIAGTIKITKKFLPLIQKGIINIGSGAGETGYGGMTTYCATKFAVRGFTQALAREYPKLQIVVVNPRGTATRMTQFTGDPPEKVAEVICNVIKGMYSLRQGDDVNIWDYM